MKIIFFILLIFSSLNLFSIENEYTMKNLPKYIKYAHNVNQNDKYTKEKHYNQSDVFLKFVVPMIVKIRNHLIKNEIIEIMKMVDEDEKETTREFLIKKGYKIESEDDFYKAWLKFSKKRQFYKINNYEPCNLISIEDKYIDFYGKERVFNLEEKKENLEKFEFIQAQLRLEGYKADTFKEVIENLEIIEKTGKRICKENSKLHIGLFEITDCAKELLKNKNFFYNVAYPQDFRYYSIFDYSKLFEVTAQESRTSGEYCYDGEVPKLDGKCFDVFSFIIRVYYDYRPSLYIYKTFSGISKCRGY